MEIILKTDLDSLGLKGEIVNVKAGYARNYLIPQGIALIANRSNKKSAEQDILQAAKKASKLKEEAEKIAKQLSNNSVTIKVKATNEEGKIYGSINALQVAQEIKKEYRIELESKNIIIPNPIKTLGEHNVTIQLRKDVSTEMKVIVENES